MSDAALTLLLDFDDQYRRDQQQSSDFLHRRDRRLALHQGLDGRQGTLPGWLRATGGRPLTAPHQDPRLRTWRWLRLLFVLAGAALGIATMLGLLYYDGGRRINVTLVMAVALLQLLLALLTSGQALLGWRPWRALLGDGLPRWWPAPTAPAPMLRAVQVPLATRVAHSGGLAFAVAALLTLLTQVLIHDLAFGWSTTLETSAPAYHDLTTALAWPWRSWLPQAVPSLDLVEQSRYFRIGNAAVSDPARLGDWWTFLAMLWFFYALLPRLLLLALSHAQLSWRARQLLATHPGRAAWRQRCDTPWVSNGGDVTANNPPVPATGEQQKPPPAQHAQMLIRWAGAGDATRLSQRLGDPLLTLDAGGAASLAQDQQVLAQAHQAGGPLILATRGWEPPTGELADFLQDARQRLGDTLIQLVPLAPGDQPALASDIALAPWRRFVARHGDAALVLADLPSPEASP